MTTFQIIISLVQSVNKHLNSLLMQQCYAEQSDCLIMFIWLMFSLSSCHFIFDITGLLFAYLFLNPFHLAEPLVVLKTTKVAIATPKGDSYLDGELCLYKLIISIIDLVIYS